MSKHVNVERKGDIYVITLQKPPENRLDVATCQELIQVSQREGKDFISPY